MEFAVSEVSVQVDCCAAHVIVTYSAYGTKKFFCLFERPFKIQKNGVFLFEISFFVLEILTFLLCIIIHKRNKLHP